MVCIDRRMGRHPEHSYCCRYYVSKRYARTALAVSKLFEPADDDATPDFLTVQIPEWDETAIRVRPDTGVTAVLGSDYTGEAKKSFLRLFLRRAKEKGGLGLHAGSKRVTIRRERGEREQVGQVFLGLSATGKSTLTAHGLWLDEPEEASMLQDDVCALLPDGTVAGSEGNGLYVKTIGLGRDEQPAMYDAVTHESAVLENVAVDEDGTVDFDSDEHTTNGRAAILREQIASADDDIDLDRVDQVFFITRNPTMPPVARLSPEESVTILREIARRTVEWTDDQATGLTIPDAVPGMDIEEFAVPDHVDDYERKLQDLRAERRASLAAFDDLDGSIRNAVY